MKNGPLLFLGLFGALTISWGGMVLLSHRQLGGLAPYYDETEGGSFPAQQPGIAARGQLVYADLGCASCHTQAVRRPDYGADQARGWGERQSVARDYIYQSRVQLGAARLGPDLANLAARKPPYDAEDLLKLLYTGQGGMPAYKFLFEERAIVGQQSAVALKLTGGVAAPTGSEIVPTERARTLVAYLLSLNNTYDYPESRPVPHEAEKKEGEHAAKKAGAPEAKKEATPAPATATAPKKEGAPSPAAAPAAKKEGEKK